VFNVKYFLVKKLFLHPPHFMLTLGLGNPICSNYLGIPYAP
jgi:hypothetical protein